jgi:hypothetical protein
LCELPRDRITYRDFELTNQQIGGSKLRTIERILAASVMLMAFSPAEAQRVFTLVTDSGRWEPMHSLSSRGQLTAAQDRVLNERVRSIMDVFRSAAPLDPPHGYRVVVGGTLCDTYSCPAGAPATASMSVVMHPFLRNIKTGVISQAGLKFDGVSIDVEVNQARVDWRPYDAQAHLLIEPTVTGHVAGYPVYEHRYLVVTKIPRPLYIPLSQEEYIRGRIASQRTSLGDTKAAIAKGSPLQQWLANRKANTDAFMQGNAIVAQTDPAKAKQQREDYLRGMDETERMLRSQESANTGALADASNGSSRTIRALEAELAGLSPGERAAPAYLPTGRNSSTRASGLASRPDGSNTQMLIVPNPQFFDQTLPRTAIQVITIDLPGMRDNEPDNAADSLRVAVRGALDYARLAALLSGAK